MAKAAAAALNLDLAASWVVGDRPEDLGLAEAVGASAIYLGPEGPGPEALLIRVSGRSRAWPRRRRSSWRGLAA